MLLENNQKDHAEKLNVDRKMYKANAEDQSSNRLISNFSKLFKLILLNLIKKHL